MRLKLILGALIAALIFSLSYVPDAVIASIPKVDVARAEKGLYNEYVSCSGEIVAMRTKELYCALPVYVTEVMVCVGDIVEEGQTLARIDRELSEALASAGNKAPTTDYSALISQYGLDEKTAEAFLASYAASGVPIRKEKVEYQEYDIPSVLKAPMAGIITEVNISESVLTDNSKPLLVLSDNSEYGVRLSVGEGDVSKIQEGDRVAITGTGFEGEHTAYVTKIYPSARREISGTVTETVVDIEAALAGGGESLKSGFSVRARIMTEEPESLVMVPYAAVRQDASNMEYVYVFSGGKAFRRNIVTGIELSDTVAVIRGLSEGEQVVIQPDKLTGDRNIVLKRGEKTD